MMRPQSKQLTILLLLFLSGFLTACFHDDDDHVDQATIIPAVNPKFDTVTTVAKSDTADGTYTDLAAADFTYDVTTETITLAEGQVGANGNFFRITGTATAHHDPETFTVYTFVSDNDTDISANELTTYAVAAIVAGNKNHDDETITTFDMAVTHLTHQTDLSVMDITMAMTESQRADIPNLLASMSAMIESVEGDATEVNLTTLAAVTPPNMDQIAWGALLFDNWMTAPTEAPAAGSSDGGGHVHNHGKPQARAEMDHDDHGGSFGENKKPAGLGPMLMAGAEHKHFLDNDGEEFEVGFRRFARCKECHGWDQQGNMGSFENRNRGTKTLTNPDDDTDSGDFRRRPKAIADTDLTDNTAAYSMMDIVPATGSGNLYANVDPDSPIMAATASAAADAWNTKTDEEDGSGVRLSDMHPDFTRTTAADATGSTNAFEGTINDIVPTHDQVMALVAFLNYEGGKPDHVITWDSTEEAYELDHDADADDGQHFYAKNCFRCHGAPNTEMANPLHHDYENMMGFLGDKDSSDNITGLNQMRFSALFHVARWGKSGAVMTRDRISYPTAHDVVNLMAYLKAYTEEVVVDSTATAKYSLETAMGNMGMGVVADGKTLYEASCHGCHQAHDGDTETSLDGEDTTFRCHNHDDDAVVATVDGVCPTGSAAIPNLAPHMSSGHMMIRHFGMKDDLGDINKNMANAPTLTQQNMNDLAAFFNSIGATMSHDSM